MGYITPDRKPGLSPRFFIIPTSLLHFVNGAFLQLCNPHFWEQVGDMTPEECANEFYTAWENMVSPNTGTILPTIGSLPPGCLWLDGTSHLITDYPRLAAVIDPQFIAGEFIVLPDLTGVFLRGGSLSGLTGGEEYHTLTIDEIPPHSHNGHAHLPGQASGELPTQVPDFPVPNPLDSAGGGLPHNNLPPYFTVRYCIVAI